MPPTLNSLILYKDHPWGTTNNTVSSVFLKRCDSMVSFFLRSPVSQIPQLFPFIKETADEWLKPRGVNLKKNKHPRPSISNNRSLEERLESLVPSQPDTNSLVTFYINNLERLHRIIHIPTFKREYAKFWVPEQTRQPAMMAIVLLMLAISNAMFVNPSGSQPTKLTPQLWSTQCISVAEEWLMQQSPKHRTIVYHQVSCLLYLAKRSNMVGKKWYWKETGSLVQNAIMGGLHRESSLAVHSSYMTEMKRRLWVTISELDLQNSFEYGLPTLLYNIESNVAPPANLNDDDFDEATGNVTMSRVESEYTRTSYQFYSSKSWKLRLEVSRRVSSTGLAPVMPYADVLQLTHEITEEICSLPSWIEHDQTEEGRPQHALVTCAMLHFQLKECIIAMHRPFLQNNDGRFWISENISQQMSREILHHNRKLDEWGVQSLTWLREDLLSASLSLTRMAMLPSSESIVSNLSLGSLTQRQTQILLAWSVLETRLNF